MERCEAFAAIVRCVRAHHGPDGPIPLHQPVFGGREKEYLVACIDSGFVSSVGPFVDEVEKAFAEWTGAPFAVAASNGTSALHASLVLAGVGAADEVITQPLGFVATANAISYTGASPVFLDVDRENLGLSPRAIESFLSGECTRMDGRCIHRRTGRRVAACVPVHIFGHSCRIDEIVAICKEWGIPVVEDAAEAVGSRYHDRHLGRFGRLGAFSFNGNKIVTSGGGGMIITEDPELARRAKHLTTTAKIPHRWEYRHDAIGFNYRLPNLNAALLLAQLEQLDGFLEEKRTLADHYQRSLDGLPCAFIQEPPGCRSNYWLNAVLFGGSEERDAFLQYSNDAGIMTRPAWELLNRLPMFAGCRTDSLENARWLADRIVNLPSSVRR